MLLRIAGLFNVYFFEEDEISIAAGVAALVRDNIGDFYRYSPQLGYYRLIEFIDLILGGDVKLIPAIMKYLSALMGVLIPCLGLYIFRAELSSRARWFTAFLLVANPVVWKSSQYGNTAMVATGVAFTAVTILSNRPKLNYEMLALVLFAAAILLRADTVLLLPLLMFLFYRNHHSVKTALIYMISFGISLLVIYALLFIFDPRLDNAVAAVANHFSLQRGTMFWEYLMWAISPLPVIFALLGIRKLMDKQPALLLTLLIWFVPPMAFYFASTTTPRYFLLSVLPLSITAAIGMIDIIKWLQNRFTARLAWITVIGAAFIHLFIGLGHFQSGWRASPFYGPGFRTDDGYMPTGALIYDTYFRDGFLFQSFNNPGFAKSTEPFWEGRVYNQALAVLANKDHANITTLLLFSGGYWHAFHYHAQEQGVEFISRAPTTPSFPFSSETWLKLGDTRFMTIDYNSSHYTKLKQYKVKAGDEIWFIGKVAFPDAKSLKRLPPGLTLTPIKSFSDKILIFRVQSGAT